MNLVSLKKRVCEQVSFKYDSLHSKRIIKQVDTWVNDEHIDLLFVLEVMSTGKRWS